MAAAPTGGETTNNRKERKREIEAKVASMEPVRLRPVLGIAPGTYLAVLLCMAVALLSFLTLVVPGLRFNGTIAAVTTSPPGAAIHVNGQFAGTTPAKLRLPRGSHTLRLSRPSFSTEELALDVGGRIIGSWLFPRRTNHRVALELVDSEALLDSAVIDFAASPLLARSLTAGATVSDLKDTEDKSHFVHRFIQHATPDTAGVAVQAAFLAFSGPTPPAPGDLARFVSFIIQYVNAVPGAPALLAKASPLPIRPRVVESDWFRKWRESEQGRLQAWLVEQDSAGPGRPRSLSVGSLTFWEIPAGDFVMGDTGRIQGFGSRASPVREMPHLVNVPRFYSGEREVSKREFAAFVAANPRWAPSNRSSLVAEGLSSDDYLGDWTNKEPRPDTLDQPVTYVSFFAAEAYAAWLSEHPVVRDAGLIARLPHEPEWERAARGGLPNSRYPTGSEARTARVSTPRGGPADVGFSAPNGYGLRDTIGNVWEWIGDWYGPNAYFLRSTWERDYGPDRRFRLGAERVVRGGSFADDTESVAVHTRGAQPPEWCTPVLGFRLVLADQ